MTDLNITISGTSYYNACEPDRASSTPVEEGWPAATIRKRGRGVQARYVASPETAALIASHLRELGSSFAAYGSDPQTRAQGRAMLRDAERVAAVLTAAAPEPRKAPR